MLHLGLLVGSLVGMQGAPARGDAAQLRKEIEAAQHALEIAEGELRGSGLEFLVENAGAAAFCALGESHGNRETPLLARTLLRRLRPGGYGAYVLETGPVTTARLVELARAGGTEAVAAVFREQPYTAAFLNFAEELAAFAEALALGMEVWGIDQEFVGCCRFLLGELERHAKTDAARARVRASYERAWAGFDHFLQTGNDSRAFMKTAESAQELDELARALEPTDPAARLILDEMRASLRIYRHYAEARYFENNAERVRLMKRHFDAALADLETRQSSPARALIKLGAVHSGRGFSPMDQLDVGNHAAELAAARGFESFHVYVFARRSTDGKDWSAEPGLRPFLEVQREREARVFDLRPLRPFLSARARDPDFAAVHELCRRYDALVLFAELHAATDVTAEAK